MTFVEGCSRSDPGRSDAAAYVLRSLPTCDVVVWLCPLFRWVPEMQVSTYPDGLQIQIAWGSVC